MTDTLEIVFMLVALVPFACYLAIFLFAMLAGVARGLGLISAATMREIEEST